MQEDSAIEISKLEIRITQFELVTYSVCLTALAVTICIWFWAQGCNYGYNLGYKECLDDQVGQEDYKRRHSRDIDTTGPGIRIKTTNQNRGCSRIASVSDNSH